MSNNGTIAVVILAAGGSSRMGRPKQLLPIGGVPLLQKAVDACVQLARAEKERQSSAIKVFAVLGANRDEIVSAVDFAHCQVLVNEEWQAGMSSSVTFSVAHIQHCVPEAAGVLLVMGDQPWVTADVLANIIAKFSHTGAPIVVSSYCPHGADEKIPGPPAFFAKDLFAELLQLEGDAGARKVVMAHADAMASIDFALGAVDIDTEFDYASALAAVQ